MLPHRLTEITGPLLGAAACSARRTTTSPRSTRANRRGSASSCTAGCSTRTAAPCPTRSSRCGRRTRPAATRTRSTTGPPRSIRTSPATGASHRRARQLPFTTIRPGAYPWGNHHNAWRPAHIHFSLFGRAFTQRLVTQMYFPDDPLFGRDPIFGSVPDERARARLSPLRPRRDPSRSGRSASAATSCCAAASRRRSRSRMSEQARDHGPTPSQTVGPFLHIGLPWPDGPDVVPDGTPGAIVVGARSTDGAGDARDRCARRDLAGRPGRPLRPSRTTRAAPARPGFRGFGRCPTGPDGRYRIRHAQAGGRADGQAPHIDVVVFARGLLDRSSPASTSRTSRRPTPRTRCSPRCRASAGTRSSPSTTVPGRCGSTSASVVPGRPSSSRSEATDRPGYDDPVGPWAESPPRAQRFRTQRTARVPVGVGQRRSATVEGERTWSRRWCLRPRPRSRPGTRSSSRSCATRWSAVSAPASTR